MNYRLVSKYLGHFTVVFGLLMIPSAVWAWGLGETDSLKAFGEAIGIAILVGLVLTLLGHKAPDRMFQREGLALVAMGWILAAGIGALPFVFSGTLEPVEAYFETMSGLTTTGSTVLQDIEATDASVLFWRSFTHWIGGMGIIVLFIAVLPYLGAGGKQLFKSESPGPDPRGLSPRIKDTASILWKIYVGLTVVQTLLLMLAGMTFYDALTHTFGTLATGGFSTRNASIAAYDSLSIELVIILFMVLAGTNFGLFFAMLHGDWWAPLKNTEWKAYIGVLVLASVLITVNLMGVQGHIAEDEVGPPPPEYSLGEAARHASFLTVSIMTTTGFGTEDFNVWPYFSRTLLVLLMFVGGCAGSTGGGIKVVRFLILFKMAYWRVESTFRPKTVRPIRINGQVIDDDVQRTVYAFFVVHMFILAFGCAFMSLLGLPFQTALTSVVAALNNIGPGLELVGAVENFHFIPDSGKIFLSMCMAMGRLELFSICVMFVPAFWKHG